MKELVTIANGKTAYRVCDFIDAGTPDDIRSKYPADAAWIFEDAAWCYVVRNVKRLAHPIPYRGMQGFFEVPDDVAEGRF